MRFFRPRRVLIVLLNLGINRCAMFEERFPRRNDIAENEPASP
jgi:hypothetical protein